MVDYVGSQSFHVPTAMDMNTIRPVRCENPAGCLAGGILGPLSGTRFPRESITSRQA